MTTPNKLRFLFGGASADIIFLTYAVDSTERETDTLPTPHQSPLLRLTFHLPSPSDDGYSLTITHGNAFFPSLDYAPDHVSDMFIPMLGVALTAYSHTRGELLANLLDCAKFNIVSNDTLHDRHCLTNNDYMVLMRGDCTLLPA
jgi:hypothetical protein